MPSPKCQVCIHPQRETIDLELAVEVRGCAAVARRWNLHPRACRRHLANHMSQEQVARLRRITPAEAEVQVDELVRLGGTEAVVGMSRIIEESRRDYELCKKVGDMKGAVACHKVQLAVMKARAEYAGLIPGRKTVTNNNLVVGDMAQVFDMIDAALRPFPEARRAVAQAFAQQSEPLPALEHEA